MNKNNNLLLTVIAVAVMAIMVVGASFAYFASSVNTGNGANFTGNTAPMSSAFVATGTDCSLSVTADKMQSSGAAAGNVAATSSQCKVTINYASSVNNTPMFCTYKVYWDWTGTAYTSHSPVSQGNTTKYTGKEFTVTGATSTTETASGNNKFTNSLSSEKDFTDVTTTTNPIEVGSGTIWANTTTNTTHTWTYTMKFYNAPAYQNDLAGKTFKGNFSVSNVVC